MSQRSGTTLVEVLVAIFVMGMGLIALLTLFPIGILRMGFALNQQRAQDAARNADSVAIVNNLRNDGTMTNPGVVADATHADYFAQPLAALPVADPYGASYPLFVDPLGYANFNGGKQTWVNGIPGVLCRRSVSFVSPLTATAAGKTGLYSNFTYWDDLVFEGTNSNPNVAAGVLPGTPQSVTTNPLTVPREPRFSWAYTMRRPMTSEKGVVDCSIVVFDARPLSLPSEEVYQAANDPTLAGAAQPVYYNPANGTITIDYTAAPFGPPIRAGDWIMDVTYAKNGVHGSRHAFWYRIVATEDLVVKGKKLARYEVQQPIRGFETPLGTAPVNPLPNTLAYNAADPVAGTAALTVYLGSAVFLDSVIEVFEKGPARLP